MKWVSILKAGDKIARFTMRCNLCLMSTVAAIIDSISRRTPDCDSGGPDFGCRLALSWDRMAGKYVDQQDSPLVRAVVTRN